jgi:membrane dipeptidase
MTATAAPPPLKGITLTEEQERRAAAIHREATIVDGSLTLKQDAQHFADARAGGVSATNHTVIWPDRDLPQALREINACRRWIDANPDEVLLATTVRDIEEAKASGREGIIFGPQNTEMIGTDLSLVGTFYDLGVRIMQLTYQRQNWVGSGCGERRDGGVTRFGRELIREMNELGIVVDVSHCGPVTARDAMEISTTPVIFSHAHPNAVSPHVRAKDDDLIRAMADQGGVIGMTAISGFLYDPDRPRERPSLRMLVRHIEHVVNLVGIDHVGIALDFEETNTPEHYEAARRANPELNTGWSWEDKRLHDLTAVSEMPNVTRALVAAGFSDADIKKILGENFLRVFRAVWGA